MKQYAKVACKNEINLLVILPLLILRALKVKPAALYTNDTITF